MLFKTRGIVISYLKFRETSIIVKVFTEKFGLQTYIVNGVRSSKSKGKIALYQPLTLLDLVVYKNEQKSIQRISECRCERPFTKIPFDVKKSAVVMFLAELLSKTIKNEGLEDREKFYFIRDQLVKLDNSSTEIEHFPVRFGIKLSKYIGFEIESVSQLVNDYGYDTPDRELILAEYLDAHLKEKELPFTNIDLRRQALTCLLNYYDNHLEGFRDMKSIQVLKQLFS